jgi:sugar lactone lactonase YvrE
VADAFNHVIRKISPDGYVSTFAGTPKVAGDKNGLARQASFNEPNLVCFDRHGNLYVSDSGNFLIRKITPQGQVSTVVGISGIRGVALGKLPTSISFVSGMHVDQNDVMYLYTENSLLKIQL